MRASITHFTAIFAAVSALLAFTGCAGAKRDRTAAYFRPSSTTTYYSNAGQVHTEAAGAPATGVGQQNGNSANPGGSSRQNSDESEPARQPH